MFNMPKKQKTGRFFAKKFNENKEFSTPKRREIKSPQYAKFLPAKKNAREFLGR